MRVSNSNDAPPGVGTSYVAHLIALDKRCKQLKREPGAVETLIGEMEKLGQKNSLSKTVKEDLQAASPILRIIVR
ncbi:MAG: hypothetical protein QX197_05270 [Methylococcaceae bacterium]